MAGIIGFGSYVPRYRLPREVIAKEWGQPSMGGEKAVANHDEDSLTLAVNAATHCFADTSPAKLAAVFFASTTSPYREKQAAATVAAVLDTGSQVRTADFTDSLRAGTSALQAGLDAVGAGAKTVLVCAGDCRMGEPDSPAEQNYGDAGAAVLLGGSNVIAEVLGSFSLSEEFHGTWRTEGQDYLHSFPGGFETKFGYTRFVTAAIQGVLKQCNLMAQQITTAVIAAPNPRVIAGVAKAAGLDPKKQINDTLWAVLGDTGTTQPLLLLAAALERAKPGDIVLLASYGDGGDAFVFKVTDAIPSYHTARSVYSQIETKRHLSSYGKYARFRKLIRKEDHNTDLSTPVVLFRDQKAVLPLYGGRCPKCQTVQFPKHRICVECGHRDGLEEVKLSRRGTLFTFTNDFLFESPDQPVTHAVVELDGGGRVYVQMTDCPVEQVEIDMPLELTFRKYHEGFGMNNYFWKARPAA
ncbi:MAG TPA: OB-fold domain-containing protein [Candidatus Kryptonia bacterium]|nr:OB-fold domain-containing protein [Candidatus Kryptonia bacterium]